MTGNDFAGSGAVAEQLGRRDAVSLAELNEVAELQTRVDRKYIVDAAVVQKMLADLPDKIRVLEIEGDRLFSYESVYFDTEDFDLYLDTAHRRRRRYKVRTRVYKNSGTARLEVKTKGGRGLTIKQSVAYDPADARQLTREGQVFVDSVVARDGAAAVLRPTLTTQYERATLLNADTGARLTIDQNLVCTDWQMSSVRLDAFVLESKSPGKASAFDRWLWAEGHRPAKLSKFCTGLAALHSELPSNKWHRTLRRHFGTPTHHASQGLS